MDAYNDEVLLQRFAADGSSVGAPISIGGSGLQGDPQVVRLADGGFVVAWTSGSGFNNSADVFAQRFTATGETAGPAFMLNTGEYRDQRLPELVELGGGGFVALWSQPQQDAPTSSPGHNPYAPPPTFVLTAQVYDATGGKVGGYTSLSSPVAALRDFEAQPLPNGGFLIVREAFTTSFRLEAQAYSALAQPVGPPLALTENGSDPRLAVLDDGSFVVAYRRSTAGDADVAVQHFSATGEKIGPETIVQSDRQAQVRPEIEALPDGGYMVSYFSQAERAETTTYPETYQLYVQRFDALDRPVGGPIQLSSQDQTVQTLADMAVAADGTTLAVWTSRSDGGDADAVGRLIARDGVGAPEPDAGQVLASPSPGSRVVGGEQNDTLTAGAGPDVLTGGGGADRFVLSTAPWAPVEVTDFQVGVDRLDLRALFDMARYQGFDPIRDKVIQLVDDGAGGAAVLFDRDGVASGQPWPDYVLHLQNVSVQGLTWAKLREGAPANQGDIAAGGSPPPAGDGMVITSPGPGSTLAGGAGNDTLVASQGPDVLTGGGGGDAFTFKALPWNAGRITDFVVGVDRLDLSAIFQASGYFGSDPSGDGRLRLDSDGAGGTRVYFDADAPNAGQWPFLITTLDSVTPAGLTWGQLSGGGASAPPPPPPAGEAGRVIHSPGPGSTLAGGGGNDTLNASQGPDQLTGGGGAVQFAWAQLPWNAGHVTDFSPGVDKLDLRALFQASGYAGSDPIADGRLMFRADGQGGTQVYLDRDAANAGDWPFLITTLDGVQPGQIGAGDWLFQ
ncbi:hypothetical protein [Phenylobacterium sp.]|uniref:hypothetical protein n=1 Tax=Phenylobacterium sp. TaxID=1871053 RepID=UPI00286D9BF1|nr:hypothetical protein [Phenylobacterium sp.]